MDYSLITNENLDYCVYAHVNKINGKVYIGISKNIKNRWKSNGGKYKSCQKFYNAIQKYGWDNFAHIILIENISSQMAAEIEMYLIQKYDTINSGYNLVSGGFGIKKIFKDKKSHDKHTNKNKVYQYNLDCELINIYGNYMEVFPNSEKKTNKIYDLCSSEKKTVYKHSIWSFDNNINIADIQKCADEYKAKHKQIDQYDLDGNYIDTFASTHVIEKLFGFDHYLIGQACKHIIKTAYGYQWNYHDEEFVSADEYKGIALPVLQFDLDGNFIKEYKNAITAALEISNGEITTGSHISAACRNKKLTAYGFQWRLKRNYNNDIQPVTHDLKKPKKVIQYDLNGNYINEFDSMADAARSVTNGNKNGKAHIAQVCKHERNTAYGFIWEFAEGGDTVCR